MVNSNTRQSLHLQRKLTSSRTTVLLIKHSSNSRLSRSCRKWISRWTSRWWLNRVRLSTKWNHNRSPHHESRSTQDRRLRIDQESMTMIVSTFCLVVTSLTHKDTISTRKDSISWAVIMTPLQDNTFLALNMLICPCKRTKVIMLVTIETPIRKLDLEASTMECRKTTLNLERTMAHSMLTKEIPRTSMDNSIRISSLTRAGGTTINSIAIIAMAAGSMATLSRKTSTEGTLQTGLTRTRLLRIRRWTMANLLTKCRLAQRTRSREIATINRSRSHSSLLSIRHKAKWQTISLSKMDNNLSQLARRSLSKNRMRCWLPSCEMGGGRIRFDQSCPEPNLIDI